MQATATLKCILDRSADLCSIGPEHGEKIVSKVLLAT
jgi:hypothetical protein